MAENRYRQPDGHDSADFSSGGSTQSALLQNLDHEEQPHLLIDDDEQDVEVVEARVTNSDSSVMAGFDAEEDDAVAALVQELEGAGEPVAEAKPLHAKSLHTTQSKYATRQPRKPSPLPGMILRALRNPLVIAAIVVTLLIGSLLGGALMFSSNSEPPIASDVVMDSEAVDAAMIKAAALEAKGDYPGALRTLQSIRSQAPAGLQPSSLGSDIERLQHLVAD